MDLTRFFQLASHNGWKGIALWGVLLAQALLWVGLVRLHLALRKEEAPWDECIGKIRSASLRQVNAQDELSELKVHRYSPAVDRLVALHFQEIQSDRFDRWMLMHWKVKESLGPYWIRLGHLIIGFGVVVWLLYCLRLDLGLEKLIHTPCDPRLLWVWLGYAMLLVWKLIRLYGHLERVHRALLLPRRQE